VETVNGFLRHLAQGGATGRALAEVLQPVKEPVFLPGSVMTHEQARRLLAAVPTDTPEGYRLRAMLEVLYSSGLRIAELLGLDLGDVDFGHATAKVLGKGRKERIVPIGRTALQYLQGYIRAVRPLAAGTSDEKAIFVDGDGKRFPYYTFLRLLHATARRVGIKVNVTPHTFRRSCATELLRGGANMYHVKELLGHESLETLKHYARLTIQDLKKEHERCHPREREASARE
jgi:site-specific recombinase XerD